MHISLVGVRYVAREGQGALGSPHNFYFVHLPQKSDKHYCSGYHFTICIVTCAAAPKCFDPQNSLDHQDVAGYVSAMLKIL